MDSNNIENLTRHSINNEGEEVVAPQNENNATNKEDDSLLLPQNEKQKITVCTVLLWITEIGLWVGAISLIWIDVYRKSEYSDFLFINTSFLLIAIFEGVIYINYVIFQFCTSTFSYLLHKKNEIKLNDLMKKLLTTPPKIEFVCVCYHYETRTVTTYDAKGNSTTRTETVRVVTRTASKFFDYYSARDVSGLFLFNYDESSVINKNYVKLELSAVSSIADTVTYSDYQKEKDEFYNLNVNYDTYMDFYENTIIEGLTKLNLINITESNPCGISLFWYIIFIFLALCQVYKTFINSRTVYKSFTIRKIFSSRYDITTEEFNNKYKKFDPKLDFGEKKIKLKNEEFCHICNDFPLKIPTQEEIESAEQYKDKIFNLFGEGKTGEIKESVECKDISNKENNQDINTGSNNGLEVNLINKDN